MPLVTRKHMKLNRLHTPMWSGVIAFSAFHCSQRIFFIVDYEPDAGKEKKKRDRCFKGLHIPIQSGVIAFLHPIAHRRIFLIIDYRAANGMGPNQLDVGLDPIRVYGLDSNSNPTRTRNIVPNPNPTEVSRIRNQTQIRIRT